MNDKSKITPEELKANYGLKVGDVISFPDAPQHGLVLLAYYKHEGTVIPVYLMGNFAADLFPLEMLLDRNKEFEKHRITRTGLTIS